MNELAPEIKLTYLVAIAIMMLLVSFIVFVVFLYNKRQQLYANELLLQRSEHERLLLQKELEKKEVLDKERERIAHDMHDDLGAGISALKLQAEFLKRKLSDQTLKEDIDDLLMTSEIMNHSMREMLWSLNSKNDNLENFSTYISSYAQNFLKKSNIQLEISVNLTKDSPPVSAFARRNLLLCVKEALNNLYKHSDAENAKLIFNQTDREITIDIVDDGKGLGASTVQGNGLNNMRVRMVEIGGSFEVIPSKSGLNLRFTYPTGNSRIQ